jgi:nicotinate-nucleotide pyrophosphorylase (carboxylating)
MRDGGCTLPIQVECDTMEQVQETLALDVRSILLDNMAPDRLKEAMTLRGDKSVRLEASGGITLETIVDIARVGIDDISIGAITHSAPTIDIGLDEDA